MIQAGRQDRRLTFFDKKTTTNEVGEEVTERSKVATVWGESMNLAQIEMNRMAGKVMGGEAKWRIRYNAKINTSQLIVYDEVEYEIVSIREEGRREGLIIIARQSR